MYACSSGGIGVCGTVICGVAIKVESRECKYLQKRKVLVSVLGHGSRTQQYILLGERFVAVFALFLRQLGGGQSDMDSRQLFQLGLVSVNITCSSIVNAVIFYGGDEGCCVPPVSFASMGEGCNVVIPLGAEL